MKNNIIRLFLLPVGFTISLVASRVFYSGSFMYLFFAWNICLAIIPLLISIALLGNLNKRIRWIFFACWLLFFPNALYIITDLLHLKQRNNIPLWYDVVLIFSAAINGLLMAFVSLQHVETFLRSKFNRQKTGFILFACLFLSSFGIYLGRFLRWNSWDIIVNPFGLSSEVLQHFTSPAEHPRTWGVTIIFTMFFSVFYFMVKKLPGIIANQATEYEKTLIKNQGPC